jgi:membrane protein
MRFITYEMWHLNKAQVDAADTWFIKFLKVLFISIRGFFADKISLRASALTFYTLIAMVPVLALFMAVSGGFGLQENLVGWLREHFEQQQEVLEFLLTFSDSMLSSTKGGVFTGVSIIFLLWAVLSLLNNIEISFNHIWQVRRNRPWVRKFTDYLSVMLVAPVFLIASSSITLTLHQQVTALASDMQIYSYIAPVVKLGFKALSMVLLWLMFSFLYVAIPYTKVKFTSALVPGILVGTCFQLVQIFYIYSQVMVSKYSAIYGSFAAIPLFLLWAQTSWLILLFGAKLSFAIQNVTRFDNDETLHSLSIRQRKQLTLQVVHAVVKAFERGEPPLSSSAIALQLQVPVRLVRDALYDLLRCNLVSETLTSDPAENAYQPSRDIHAITVSDVLERIETQPAEGIAEDYARPPFAPLLAQMAEAGKASGGEVRVMEV